MIQRLKKLFSHQYAYEVEETSLDTRCWTIYSNKPLVTEDGNKEDLLEAMDVTVNPGSTSVESKLSNGAMVEVSFDVEPGDDAQFDYTVCKVTESIESKEEN